MMIAIYKPSEYVDVLYDKVKNIQGLPEYKGPEGKEFFTKGIMEAALLIVFSFGYCRITDFIPGYSARAHGIFWSRDVLKSMGLLREAAYFVIESLSIKKLEVVIPADKKSLDRLVTGIGFKEEATLRDFRNNGILPIEATLYSIRRNQ